MIEYLIPVVVGALMFVLGRRTTFISALRPSADTSAAWQKLRS
jgi:hypothetical protein